ncbi:hypothetical protein [uncultured Draconibacterium sp.]|uniref:hypothetical protein n=1 Tax=uncultured Draconibacterium sp. TaxID=1573823 RepID=UPI0029C8F657|nr:hypothetical protein [uncultured Draconibacterium sp.]
MEKISSNAELQNAILNLEAEQAVKLKLMKEQFNLAYENLKPAKLIESTLKDITASPHLINKIIITFLGMFTGYLSQKVITRRSGSKFRKLFGYILQYGITNLVASNAEAIKSFWHVVSHRILYKKE